MSLKDVYHRFLDDPASASLTLAPDISLLYITTATRFDQPDAVVGHFSQQGRVLKKSEEVVSTIEGPDSLCLDIETTLEFVSGGGTYLPSLDDNFLADRAVIFPSVHIVRFNAERQIKQVRLYWDQGSLLKQIGVIGSRGRCWPICDATDQMRLLKSAALPNPVDSVPSPTDELSDKNSQPHSARKKLVKDPYAADSLTDLLSPGKDRVQTVRSPRTPATAAPPPRDLGELFMHHDDISPEQSPSKKVIYARAGASKNFQASRIFDCADDDADKSQSQRAVASKSGAGQNFKPSRIFDVDGPAAADEEKNVITYKTNPNRFSHFEIGGDNSMREVKQIPTRPKSQHVSHWNFEDFVTPEKPTRKVRGQEIRHFGWSDDDVDLQQTPPARPYVPQPRRDAESHIRPTDDINTSIARRNVSSISQNPLYQEGGDSTQNDENKSVRVPSVAENSVSRKKDFDSHWNISNTSSLADGAVGSENEKPISSDRLRAVQMMTPSWENYDQSPQRPKTQALHRGTRSVTDRHWGFEDM